MSDLMRRLFEEPVPPFLDNGFSSDLAAELRSRYKDKYDTNIEERLNISGFDVSNITDLITDTLIDWAAIGETPVEPVDP